MVDDLLGVAEEALGKEGSGTFEMLGDFDGVAECLEEFDGFDTDGRIVEVGEFVAEEENFASAPSTSATNTHATVTFATAKSLA